MTEEVVPVEALTSEVIQGYEDNGWPTEMTWAEASAAVALEHGVEGIEFPYPMLFAANVNNFITLMVDTAGKITTFAEQPLLITRSVKVRNWKLADERLAKLVQAMGEPDAPEVE